MTFHGRHRGPQKYFDAAHESPLVMLIPLGVLGLGAVFAGTVFYETFMYDAGFWAGSLPVEGKDYAQYASLAAEGGYVDGGAGGHHDFPLWVLWAPVAVSAIGFVTAWLFYRDNGAERRIAEVAETGGSPLYRFLLNKWYIDELYQMTVIRGAKALGDLFWLVGDRRIIDGLGPNGFAAMAAGGGRLMSRFQSGYLYQYAFVMLLGLALIFVAVFL